MTIEGIEEPVPAGQYDMKKESGGLLIQDMDLSLYDEDALKVVTEKAPTDKEMADMKMAMKVVKHIKSNGIVYVKDGATVGIGQGTDQQDLGSSERHQTGRVLTGRSCNGVRCILPVQRLC